MSYVLRMKKEAYNRSLGTEGKEPPYLSFDGTYARGTPHETDADRFPTKKSAGEAFDASGCGRRNDYECIVATTKPSGGYASYKLRFT